VQSELRGFAGFYPFLELLMANSFRNPWQNIRSIDLLIFLVLPEF